MRHADRTLDDCEIQHNEEVGLFTRPLMIIFISFLYRPHHINGGKENFDNFRIEMGSCLFFNHRQHFRFIPRIFVSPDSRKRIINVCKGHYPSEKRYFFLFNPDKLNILIPSIKNVGCTVIAFTGNTDSTLAKNSDIIINVGVDKEACPLGLAPTASTTALLAMGDALAVVLINKKHFQTSDFKKIHPGGAIGQRLTGKVSDIMLAGDLVPLVGKGASMEEAVKIVDRFKLGAALILGANKTLAGIITDGDIRRFIACQTTIAGSAVEDAMTINPQTTSPGTPAYDALNIMEKYQITVLPVTDNSGKIRGILHLHDILGKGEFKFNGK